MISTSPLRYPGGKTRFSNYVKSVLSHLDEPVDVFVEPFCGGAGLSIALLETRQVPYIAINDLDPLVASFWQIVFGRGSKSRDDLEWLIKQIETVDISLQEWQNLKSQQPSNKREAAWKCLFLNRTSFNGIIHKAGPIGGWKQINRTLDVRFNRTKLIEKILKLSDYRMRVDKVGSSDWRIFCDRYKKTRKPYIYIDPPYYHRAEQLYGYLFDESGHLRMRNYLKDLQCPWLLSYDDAPEVRALYSNLTGVDSRVVDQTYSTHPVGGASFVGRELLFSNRPLPQLSTHPKNDKHIGLSVVGTLLTPQEHQNGPSRIPIATKLTTTKSL